MPRSVHPSTMPPRFQPHRFQVQHPLVVQPPSQAQPRIPCTVYDTYPNMSIGTNVPYPFIPTARDALWQPKPQSTPQATYVTRARVPHGMNTSTQPSAMTFGILPSMYQVGTASSYVPGALAPYQLQHRQPLPVTNLETTASPYLSQMCIPRNTSLNVNAQPVCVSCRCTTPQCTWPCRLYPFLPPSCFETVEQKHIQVHAILDTSQQPLRWDVRQDLPTAAYCGRPVSHNQYHDQAFQVNNMNSTLERKLDSDKLVSAQGLHEIVVLVGLESIEERGFARLEPEVGQRLFAFVVSSASEGLASSHDLKPEVGSSSCKSTSQSSSPGRNDPEQSQGGAANTGLDVLGVLNGIRRGLHEPLKPSVWVALTLREKYILARRVAARRLNHKREHHGNNDSDSNSGTRCNEEFLRSAIELESLFLQLIKEGRAEAVQEASKAIREGHRQVDAYVFGNSPSQTESRPPSSSHRPASSTEPVRIIDLLGAKRSFKGLKWMNWSERNGRSGPSCEGTGLGLSESVEAFFLCVA